VTGVQTCALPISIYGINNTTAITNAVNKILDYNLDLEKTLNIADSLAHLYQDELTNPRSKYYAGSPQAAQQSITNIVNGLSFQSINSKPFKADGLARHAGPRADHDHMAEMGASTPQEYQQKAMDFMKGDPNTDEIQLQRPNGEIIRYNLKTHEFGVVYGNGSDAGKLVTYYKVDSGSNESDLDYVLSQVYKQDR